MPDRLVCVSTLVNLLGFCHTIIIENSMKKRKYPESDLSLDKNAVLMPGGQRKMARIPQAYGKGTDTYKTTC